MKDNIFDIVNSKVVINENVLLIPWLKAIEEKYDNVIHALCYCHYFTFVNGPYYTYPEDVRQDKLLKDFPGDYKITDKEICDAINNLHDIRVKYNTVIRYWDSCKILLEKLSDYNQTVILDDGKEGNMTHVQRNMDKLGQNIKSYTSATKIMEEEQSKARGQTKRGYDQ